jgi:AraC-like DNA-binding protein
LEKAPSEYMIHWHMMVARNALKRDSSNLATTAEAVGFCDFVSV